MGVANVIHAYAPLVVSVGGAVALNNPESWCSTRSARSSRTWCSSTSPRFALTELGDDVVVKGALASALTGGTGDRSRVDPPPR